MRGRGDRERSGTRGSETLDDLLFGLEEQDGGGPDGLLKGAGGRGAGNLLRLSRAIERDPDRWSQWFDSHVARKLNCHVTGLPWSLELYGQQKVRFGQLERHQYMWQMVCCLHSLHRAGEHAQVGAKLGQFAKAIEASVMSKGRWDYAWLYTGLEDPRAHLSGAKGLIHPAEFTAAVAYTREVRSLDEYIAGVGRRRAEGDGGGNGASNDQDEPWWKKKKKKPEGGGAGGAIPPGGGGGNCATSLAAPEAPQPPPRADLAA